MSEGLLLLPGKEQFHQKPGVKQQLSPSTTLWKPDTFNSKAIHKKQTQIIKLIPSCELIFNAQIMNLSINI